MLLIMNTEFRARRKELRLNQTKVAAAADLNQADISRIESQDWFPARTVRERLAAVLETTPEAIFVECYSIAS